MFIASNKKKKTASVSVKNNAGAIVAVWAPIVVVSFIYCNWISGSSNAFA